MVREIKRFSGNTKRAIEKAYEVLAMGAAIAAAVKVANLTSVNNFPVWQIVAGILLAGVAYKVYTLLSQEQ